MQVLLINVLTDGLPAVALARDPPTTGVIRRGPERSGALFAPASWVALGTIGVLVGAAAIGAFLVGRAIDPDGAQTIAIGEPLIVFTVRSPLRAAWREPRNGLLLASVAVSAALVALAIYLPALNDLLSTVPLDLGEITVVLSLALVPAIAPERCKALLTIAPEYAEAALRTYR